MSLRTIFSNRLVDGQKVDNLPADTNAELANKASESDLVSHVNNELNPHNTRFIQLLDAPASYTGKAGNLVTVKATEDGLEFSAAVPGSGTVTSVAAGNGMDFTTITGAGSVVLGTPSTCTAGTTNNVSTGTHTHAVSGFATGAGSASGANSVDVTLATNHGLSLTGQELAMGTPSSCTNATSNSVTTTTHTHAITGFLTSAVTSIKKSGDTALTGGVTLSAGTNVTLTQSGQDISIASSGSAVPTSITVANEATDTTCFPAFFTAATGDLGPKTNAGLTFNSSTAILAATGFSGPLTGNVTGNVSGTAGGLSATLVATSGGTGQSTIAVGDLLVGAATNTINKLSVTVPAAPSRLNVLGIVNGETTPTYKALFDATAPTTQAFGDSAVAGTSVVAAHRDHKHAMMAAPTSVTGNAGTVTIGNEATDTTCFPLFATAATGSLSPKTNANLKFNSNTGLLTAVLASPSTIDLGVAAGTTGSALFVGTTSGSVRLSVADAAGTWTMKLPTTTGTSNQVMQSDGSGNTSWNSVRFYHGIEAAGALTFDNSTHILSVASGTNTYWFQGTKYTTASAITCDIDSYATLTTNTLYFFFFDAAAGTLKCSASPWNLFTQVPVASVFWNGSAGAIQKETHDHTRDLDWHKWAHDTIGCRYESGLSLTNPTTVNDALLQIESGNIHDEDLDITIGQQTTMRGFYKASASVYTFADYSLPYLGTSGQPQYLDTDTYTLTNVSASNYACYWVYASSDVARPIYVIPTTAANAYATIGTARAETAPSLSGLNLAPEMKLIFRFIYRGDGQFQESADYRTSSPLPSGGSSSTTAAAVSFAPSGNIASTTVQTAIEELDTEKQPVFTWSEVTGTTQAMAVDTGYIANNAALVTLTLPSTAALGKTMKVVGKGAGLWKIAQGASQYIRYSSQTTTAGTGGYITAAAQYDTLELVCTTADVGWTVVSGIGSPSLY